MIIIPDVGILQVRKYGSLPLPIIVSPAENIATIVQGLNSSSMLSISQLCDNFCNVILNKQKMYKIKDK